MLIRTALLFVFWMVLSGDLGVLDMGFGLASALAASAALGRIVPKGRGERAFPWLRVAAYLPWLLSRIMLAAWHVSKVVMDPAMPIEPKMLRRRLKVRGDWARAWYGNSITLTPGTITVDFEGDDILVHAIDDDSAGDVVSGEMERRVAAVFGEAA